MKKVYTLIQYKEGEQGWHDRCGDYHQGEDSQMSIAYFTDPILAAEQLGIAQYNNSGGENILLINGIDPNNSYDVLTDEEGIELENEFKFIDDLAFEKRESLNKIAKQKLEEEKERKLQEENLKKIREKQAIEKREKEQLAILLNKYGK